MSATSAVEPTGGFSRLEGAAVALALVLAALLVTAPTRLVSAVVAAVLLAMMLWIAVADWRRFIVPDGPVIVLGLLGAAWRLGDVDATGLDALLVASDGIIWGGVFLALREVYFRRRGIDGIGFGDVKLAFAGAVLLGAAGFAWALLLASLAGLAGALAARGLGRGVERIPFGAFLAPACGLIWLAGLGG